jgi:NAD(P)-dependent dehydrogenase (short-subunit alcohol dehydrogenase family)
VNVDLADTVAVVTGASRGGGRAIAAVLGEAGATVYVTGRSESANATTEALPGTIHETAAEVTRRGGHGIAVRVDHTVDADVKALFARVEDEQRRLDLLVNNVWGGYEKYDYSTFNEPFWQQPLERWPRMYDAGVRAHFVASRYAAPLLLHGTGRTVPLIVSTIAWAFGEYLGNVIYDSAKAATARMMFAMAEELRPHDVAAVAIAPGFMRTERIMAAHAAQPFDLSGTETPEYLGRAIAHLAADPKLLGKSGRIVTVGELAREYGFTDVDGVQPEPFRMQPREAP